MLDALRWLGGRRAILPVTARLLCARIVRESASFFAGEVLRPRGVHLYHLRESGVQVAIRHSGVDAATLAEIFYHRFYHPDAELAAVIGAPPEILDLGANVGLFGAFAAARWPESRIVGYEADPANAAVHERAIRANGLEGRWRLVRAAAGARDGEVRFAAGLDADSHVISGGGADAHAITVPLHDVLAQISLSQLVKMDIEGGEWAILDDPRFAPAGAIVLEYHPRDCPGPDPRAAAELALARAGLRTASIWHGDQGVGMLWGWRPQPHLRGPVEDGLGRAVPLDRPA